MEVQKVKCPLCKIEMRIGASRHVVKNDDTPDKKTQLFLQQDLVCRSRQCPNYGKVVKVVENEIQLSKQS